METRTLADVEKMLITQAKFLASVDAKISGTDKKKSLEEYMDAANSLIEAGRRLEEISAGSIVTVVDSPTKFLNDSMRDWIREHDGKTFFVEKTVSYDDGTKAAKLRKVDFWISTDLLSTSFRFSAACANEPGRPKQEEK